MPMVERYRSGRLPVDSERPIPQDGPNIKSPPHRLASAGGQADTGSAVPARVTIARSPALAVLSPVSQLNGAS
jgi:hypothetical protein